MNENPMAALYAALAKAQGSFLPITKNREVEIAMKAGGRFKFRYADLEEILTKTRPALSANGLALIQTINGSSLVCQLVHAEGGVITSEVPMPGARDLADPKTFGAAITYLRRYLVTAILGVAADDDLDQDGQEAGKTNKDTGFDVTAALDAVEACTTTEKLQDAWKKYGALAVAAQDKGGHAALKEAVKEKKAQLEGVAA